MSNDLHTIERVRYPFVIKLIIIISAIVLFSATIISNISTRFFTEDSLKRIEHDNLVLNQLMSAQIQDSFDSVLSSSLILLDTLQNVNSKELSQKITQVFFNRNANIIYLGIENRQRLFNNEFFQKNNLDANILQTIFESHTVDFEQAAAGRYILKNVSMFFDSLVFLLIAPIKTETESHYLAVLFTANDLQNSIASNSATKNIVINSSGETLLYPDFQISMQGVSFLNDPLVAEFLKNDAVSKQIRYTAEDGNVYFGAYSRLSPIEAGILTSFPQVEVTRLVDRIKIRNLYLTGIVILLSILFVYFFSRSVSSPLRRLSAAAKEIEKGNYIVEIPNKTHDEFGLLTSSFIQMGQGLAEREHVKSVFGKFVNKNIAEQALRGDLSLGGTRKHATIFFSDIRSFTAISELLEPEQVVEFLNAYMTRMVNCIDKTHGVVDKFIGDAIMGVWGAPTSQGSEAQDAMNAVWATLLMRVSLYKFNQTRGTPDKPIIRIGCGLNTGPVIAGQIGSMERMEYTVIGDAVNLASRIEALNKPLATDILLSENTYNLVKERVIVQEMPPIKVKGKSAPLKIFALIKLKGAKGPETLSELRSFLGIETPTEKVDLDKEEVKYEILEQKK